VDASWIGDNQRAHLCSSWRDLHKPRHRLSPFRATCSSPHCINLPAYYVPQWHGLKASSLTPASSCLSGGRGGHAQGEGAVSRRWLKDLLHLCSASACQLTTTTSAGLPPHRHTHRLPATHHPHTPHLHTPIAYIHVLLRMRNTHNNGARHNHIVVDSSYLSSHILRCCAPRMTGRRAGCCPISPSSSSLVCLWHHACDNMQRPRHDHIVS